MTRPPPRPPLFPYRPLCRSRRTRRRQYEGSDGSTVLTQETMPPWTCTASLKPAAFRAASASADRTPDLQCSTIRSEEHTSELQSRQYLVCRLLLEKKTTTPS